MLVKHLIKELMKCGMDMPVELFFGDYVLSINKLNSFCVGISPDGNSIWIVGSNMIFGQNILYDNTHDTPFPLPEKE